MSDVNYPHFLPSLPNISYGSLPDHQRLASVNFSFVGDYITWISENGLSGYTATDGEAFFIMRNEERMTISLFEMINENKFVYVLYENPTTAVYYAHNINVNYYAETYESILGLRYHGNSFVIIQYDSVTLFNCNNNDDPYDIMEYKITYNTFPNPRALFDIRNNVFVYPQVDKIQSLLVMNAINNVAKELQLPKHREIVCMALSHDASLLCVSFHNSRRVQVISLIYNKRIFKLLTSPETILSNMYNINFSPDSKLIYCSTENGVVHIFRIEISESVMNNIYFTSSIVIPIYSCTFDSSPCITRYITDNSVQIVSFCGIAQTIEFSDTSSNQLSVLNFEPLVVYRIGY